MELPACPVETTLMLIGDKWKVLILRDLMDGTKRFGELKKSIGHVTQKVLTAQLRDMEAKGLLTRRVYAEVPPRVEYTLTPDRLQLETDSRLHGRLGNRLSAADVRRGLCGLTQYDEHTGIAHAQTGSALSSAGLI